MTERRSPGASASYGTLLRDSRFVTIVSIAMAATLAGNLLSPAMPGISDGLGIAGARVGLVITAYSLPTAFFVPMAGVLADIYGRRTVVLPALVVFGTAGAAIAFVDSFEALLALLAIQGLSSAGLGPLSVTLLGDLYTGPTGTAAQGGRVTANKSNNITVPLVVGALASISWNSPFLLFALAFPIAAVAYVYLPSSSQGNHAAEGLSETVRGYASALRFEFQDRVLFLLVAGGGFRDFVKFAVVPFVPLFAVQALGATYVEAGAVLSARGVTGIVAAPLAGLLDATSSRKLVLIGGFSVIALGVALLPTATNLLVLSALVGVFGIGDAVFSAVVKNAVTDATTDDYRAGVVGSMSMLKRLAKSAAPAFFGVVLAVTGFSTVFLVAAVIAAGYAALLFVSLPSE